jgi:hypothetical protein
MNGEGFILNYKVIPDEKHQRLKNLLDLTWAMQEHPNTECVYTDNTLKDTRLITDLWEGKYREKHPNQKGIFVLQVSDSILSNIIGYLSRY